MEKKRILIHSDNSTWAGSENMVGVFLKSTILATYFDVAFSYRDTEEYTNSMNRWVNSSNGIIFRTFPINSFSTKLYKIRPYFKPIMFLRPYVVWSEVKKCKQILMQVKPSLVHINNGGYPAATTCNSMAIAAGQMGIPCTYMINSTARNTIIDSYYTDAVRVSVSKFISASNHLRDKSQFLILDDRRNWEVIPNTITQTPDKYRTQSIRDSICNAYPTDNMILAIGNPEKRKGFHLLLDLVDEFQFGHLIANQITFVIALTGEDNKYSRGIKDLVRRTSSPIVVVNIDSKSTINWINACDMLLVPSLKDEDFPNVILMALKCGKPVVASNVGGIGEIIPKGWLIEPGNMEQAARAIGLAKYRMPKEKTKEWFKNRYSSDIIVSRYADLWSSLINDWE